MAGVQIKDATGVGYSAKVDNFNRLRTFATSTSQEHHGTGLGVNFMFSTPTRLTMANGDTGTLLYVQNNNPAALLVITKIALSSSVAGVTYSLLKNQIVGTLSNNTSVTPQNLNFQSGVTAQATTQIWNGVGTTGIGGLTGGGVLQIHPLEASSPHIIDINGGIDLGSGNILGLRMTNNTGGNAVVSLSIRAFFESTSAN